jgi:hypothetical protein
MAATVSRATTDLSAARIPPGSTAFLLTRDQWFQSGSLQRGVTSEPFSEHFAPDAVRSLAPSGSVRSSCTSAAQCRERGPRGRRGPRYC